MHAVRHWEIHYTQRDCTAYYCMMVVETAWVAQEVETKVTSAPCDIIQA